MAIETPAPASPTASPYSSSSPAGRTLSAAFAEDRRRESKIRASNLLPGCGGRSPQHPRAQLVSRLLQRWACLPKTHVPVRARAGTPTPPPSHRRPSSASTSTPQSAQVHRRPSSASTSTPQAAQVHRRPSSASTSTPQAVARQDHAGVPSVPVRRPLREREDAAAIGLVPTPTGSEASAVSTPEVVPGDGSNWRRDTATTVARGANIWVRALRKPSLQVDSPQQSVDSPIAADDMYVWADKYRPSVLGEFICNKAVADNLHRMVTERQCSHFIFEGAQAVGKRSMVLALLRDAFGPDELKIEEQTKRIEMKGEIVKHIDLKVRISDHHVEVNLADSHGYEKYVITTLLNESLPPPDFICTHANCKVIVVHDADRISSDLQHYIGWFLGRYAGCNKIIFCCSSSKNLEAVEHLCKVITLKPPSFDEIIKVLEFIATQEGIDLPDGIASRIAASASNNLRQAIRSFEATWTANYSFTKDQPILTGWEEEINNVAKKIMEEPSPKQLYLIRGKIRKMIEHNVSPYFIFCHLVTELKRDRDEDFQNSIDELASDLNRTEQCKEYKSQDTALVKRAINIEGFTVEGPDQGEAIQCFIKIEEFTVRFMSFYRSLIAKNSIRGGVS
ncbi:replication factor C subunit 3-like [Lolium rigidum]|uniref:replication factor C subunit 3-like n=1 Tax=Lolium rigidum TaxID=89674 RepID=UPI001F5E1E33|nr:replication factor C subunit 3-like [Lolium rigidum]